MHRMYTFYIMYTYSAQRKFYKLYVYNFML